MNYEKSIRAIQFMIRALELELKQFEGVSIFQLRRQVLTTIQIHKDELELYLKAQAFDEVLKSYDESLSEGHMADDVINIVIKYRGESYEL